MISYGRKELNVVRFGRVTKKFHFQRTTNVGHKMGFDMSQMTKTVESDRTFEN